MDGRPRVLVIDIGLTHVKTVIFATDGRILERESVPYPTRRAGEFVEQEPSDWWAAAVKGCRAIGGRSHVLLASVAAITVTGHMHALVLADARGEPIGPALVLGDRRALRQATRISAMVGPDEVYAITGAALDPSMPAAKIAWLRDEMPERIASAAAVLACKDWLRSRLTGDRLSDPIDACASSLYDLRTGEWSADMLGSVGVDRDRLPPVVAPQTIAGGLLAEPACELGLTAGVPVVVGAGDDVEVLGNGLLGPGQSLEHLGTTGSILTVTDRLVPDPEMRLESYPHVIPGLWVAGGSMTTAGAAIGWARKVLGLRDAFACLGEGSPAYAPVFLPHLAGERSPSRAPNARGAWLGLDQETNRSSLMRGVLVGVAFALRAILRRIETLVGRQAEISVSGGYDVEPAWLQLRADAYGRPLVLLQTSEPTALGAMAIAAAGIGVYPDVATAVRVVARAGRRIEPNPAAVGEFDRAFDRWLLFHAALEPAWAAASHDGGWGPSGTEVAAPVVSRAAGGSLPR